MTSPRIERGAALLDQTAPGWDKKIDLDSLDLSSGAYCVLGQVYGDYYDGLDAIDGAALNAPSRFGFYRHGTETWWSLTDKWQRYIETRRRARRTA